MELEWKKISGHDGKYEISNTGLIRSLWRSEPKILRTYTSIYGYVTIRLRVPGGYKGYYLHRLVVNAFLGNVPDGMQIDHIDRDKLNNNLSNLRIVTNLDNRFNTDKYTKRTYSSKYKGVCRKARDRRWTATIKINYKNIHLGMFDTEKEAAEAYNQAALKYSPHALLNNISEEIQN